MMLNFRSLLVASAIAASAASLGAVGVGTRQQGQAQPPSPQSQQSQDQTSQQPGAQGRDEAAARQELQQAKQALMDLTKLPEASQLQGDARTGVIQIINSFNSLVTAESNWYDRYQEVQQQLTRLLGNEVSGSSAESGAVGTSGTAASDMPAPVRDKLIEFRQHLVAFSKAAGAPDNAAAAGTGSAAGSTSSVAGTAGTAGTSSASGQTSSTQGTASSAQGTAGVTSAAGETFQQHFDAIADLVQQALGSSPAASSGSTSSGTTGTSGTSSTTSGTTGGQQGTAASTGTVTMDRAALEQIQSHLQRLRQLARQRGIQ